MLFAKEGGLGLPFQLVNRTILGNKKLLAGTVLVNKKLLTWTVPVRFLAGEINVPIIIDVFCV